PSRTATRDPELAAPRSIPGSLAALGMTVWRRTSESPQKRTARGILPGSGAFSVPYEGPLTRGPVERTKGSKDATPPTLHRLNPLHRHGAGAGTGSSSPIGTDSGLLRVRRGPRPRPRRGRDGFQGPSGDRPETRGLHGQDRRQARSGRLLHARGRWNDSRPRPLHRFPGPDPRGLQEGQRGLRAPELPDLHRPRIHLAWHP